MCCSMTTEPIQSANDDSVIRLKAAKTSQEVDLDLKLFYQLLLSLNVRLSRILLLSIRGM